MLEHFRQGERDVARTIPQPQASRDGLIVAQRTGVRCGKHHITRVHQSHRQPALRISGSPIPVRYNDQRSLVLVSGRLRVTGNCQCPKRWPHGEVLDLGTRRRREPKFACEFAGMGRVLHFDRGCSDRSRPVDGARRNGCRKRKCQNEYRDSVHAASPCVLRAGWVVALSRKTSTRCVTAHGRAQVLRRFGHCTPSR